MTCTTPLYDTHITLHTHTYTHTHTHTPHYVHITDILNNLDAQDFETQQS